MTTVHATQSRRFVTVTVLWADLHGFGGRDEAMASEAFAAFIDTYYTLAAESIRAVGGQIDKFMGDAVLAYFDTAEGAVAAARRLRAALAAPARHFSEPLPAVGAPPHWIR